MPSLSNAAAIGSVNANEPMWRSSKMIGVDVYNEQNEKLGDISEVLFDHSGKVSGFVVGVGGFLGMGEHNILVSFDKLKFVDQPARTATTTTTTTTTTTAPTVSGAPNPRPDAGIAGNPGTSSKTTDAPRTTVSSSDRRWYPDHAVLTANKDQLKAMPEFKY